MEPCRAVNTHKEAWRLKTEPCRVRRPVGADSYDFNEEQDRDPDLHLSKKPIREPCYKARLSPSYHKKGTKNEK
jgi:hypothetical protein